MICVVKERRYHARRILVAETRAVIALVINTASGLKTARVSACTSTSPREAADVSASALERSLLVDHPSIEATVSIDATVTQKWPMYPMHGDPVPIDVGQQDLFSFD